MKIVLLGTTGYHPSETRHTSCFLLPEIGVALDAGTAIHRIGPLLETKTLDIFLTHAHLDHVIGLTYFFDILHQRPLKRVRVHAAAEKIAAINDHLFDEALFPAKPPFDWRPLPVGPISLARGGKLTHFPLEHPGGALGFRLDWPGHSLAYVTDTTANEKADYVERIRGVDLLLHECNFTDGHEEKAALTGHSCTSAVARTARAAEVGRLVLVHVNPLGPEPDPVDLATAQAIFANVELGRDFMEVDF